MREKVFVELAGICHWDQCLSLRPQEMRPCPGLLPAASIPMWPRGCALYSPCTCWPRPNSRYQNGGILCPNAPNLLLGSKSHFPGSVFPARSVVCTSRTVGGQQKTKGSTTCVDVGMAGACPADPTAGEGGSWGRGSRQRRDIRSQTLIFTCIQAPTDVRGRPVRI